MSADSSTKQTATTLRDSAYTTPRPDVFAMVPRTARYILDVGCSNGALGRSLMSAQPGRSVCGIEFDTAFAREATDHLDHVINADLNGLNWRVALAERNFLLSLLRPCIRPRPCKLVHSRRCT